MGVVGLSRDRDKWELSGMVREIVGVRIANGEGDMMRVMVVISGRLMGW